MSPLDRSGHFTHESHGFGTFYDSTTKIGRSRYVPTMPSFDILVLLKYHLADPPSCSIESATPEFYIGTYIYSTMQMPIVARWEVVKPANKSKWQQYSMR